MTKAELRVLSAQLHAERARLRQVAARLAHGVDESVPTGNDSPRLLVDQLSEPIPSLRPALLSRELAARMDEYRRFRHAFRHMYFFDLDWQRVRPLVAAVPALVRDFEGAIDELLSQLGA